MILQPLYKKKDMCDVVKYIAALLVVNGHLFIFGNPDSVLTSFMNLGSCCVALFFFLSGYGLIYNYLTKGEGYLNGFFRKRFSKILLPFLIAYAVCVPIYGLLIGSVNLTTLLSTLFWGGPYLKFTWFVSEILIVYILFFLIMKITVGSTVTRLVALSVSIVILMLLILLLHQPLWYAVSLPGFLIGIWYCFYEDKIISIKPYKAIMALCVFFILWFATWQWNSIFSDYIPQYRYALISSFAASFFFTLFAVILLILNQIPPQLLFNLVLI